MLTHILTVRQFGCPFTPERSSALKEVEEKGGGGEGWSDRPEPPVPSKQAFLEPDWLCHPPSQVWEKDWIPGPRGMPVI